MWGSNLLVSPAEANRQVRADHTVPFRGSGISGVSKTLINASRYQTQVPSLVVVSNNVGTPVAGLGKASFLVSGRL